MQQQNFIEWLESVARGQAMLKSYEKGYSPWGGPQEKLPPDLHQQVNMALQNDPNANLPPDQRTSNDAIAMPSKMTSFDVFKATAMDEKLNSEIPRTLEFNGVVTLGELFKPTVSQYSKDELKEILTIIRHNLPRMWRKWAVEIDSPDEWSHKIHSWRQKGLLAAA